MNRILKYFLRLVVWSSFGFVFGCMLGFWNATTMLFDLDLAMRDARIEIQSHNLQLQQIRHEIIDLQVYKDRNKNMRVYGKEIRNTTQNPNRGGCNIPIIEAEKK